MSPDATPAPKAKPADSEKAEVVPAKAGEEIIGKTLGEFRVLRRLGAGGMAEVFLAEQLRLKRPVAIKVLRPELTADADNNYLERFEREATAAANLTHANIVQVHLIGEQNGIHYIAQEYVQGVNLKEFIAKKGPPPVAAAVHIIKQVSEALQAAGEAGIVHRDIKPENIMISRKGVAKVADFGLAQLSLGSEAVNLTQVGVTMGTPLYMSPEQVNGKALDHRSDLYSLGVTCYHLLTGSPPFKGETALAVAVQHLNESPVPLHERRRDVPQQLAKIIQKMMAKKRGERYNTAREILVDLRQVIRLLKENPESGRVNTQDFAVASGPQTEVKTSAWERWSSWKGRRELLAFIGAFLLVGGAAAGIGWMMRPIDPQQIPVSEGTRVTKERNAIAQFLAAKDHADDERWWKAVTKFYPDTPESRQAQLQLALLYVKHRRFQEGRQIFQGFLNKGGLNTSMQANGTAGLAVVASYERQYAESQKLIVSLKDVTPGPSETFREPLRRAFDRNKAQTGQPPGKFEDYVSFQDNST